MNIQKKTYIHFMQQNQKSYSANHREITAWSTLSKWSIDTETTAKNPREYHLHAQIPSTQ